ncbi:MAG: TetR/AcrR family transcriptional regulator [Terracoccus sp.]
MSLSRSQVVGAAVDLVRRYGLADLTMRRLARELGVAPGAIYWHVESKQHLVVQVAEVLLCEIGDPSPDLPPAETVAWLASALREAVAGVPDGPDVVGVACAVDPASIHLLRELSRAVGRLLPGQGERDAVVDLVVHHVLGSVAAEQNRRNAGVLVTCRTDAVDAAEPARAASAAGAVKSFETGLAVIVAGLVARPVPGCTQ